MLKIILSIVNSKIIRIFADENKNKPIILVMRNYDLEELRQCGNLLDSLLGDKIPIYLIRVYTYESMVGDVHYMARKEHMDCEDEKSLLHVLQNIRKGADKLGWNDNKIVCEIRVGYWRVFVGYWDDTISIGSSVIPNMHLPKYKKGTWGIEEIIIREGEKN